ncbi:MAG TPA: alpha/beta fold hydrolase, partial [Rubrivivax sp.]|nr:alpha/beta fold hydrolase [Rubrivivax sp.]
MLLLHGTGASTHSWRRLVPLLARRAGVLAVDLPGHGFSEAARGDGATLRGMARGVAALLREVG